LSKISSAGLFDGVLSRKSGIAPGIEEEYAFRTGIGRVP
jgi:hypothetical protein